MRPTNVMNTDITVAKIGLSMKKWENFMALELFQDGGDLFLRNRAADSVYYDLFAPVEPRGNHLQLADELAGRHRPVFDHVFGIDYVYEPPHEVRADRRLGDEKPLGGSARSSTVAYMPGKSAPEELSISARSSRLEAFRVLST